MFFKARFHSFSSSWDETYKSELANFADNPDDEGEIWFGEDALYRVLAWFDRNRDLVPLTASILDLGCGNGVTCLHLLGEGFTDVTGVDYSPEAIELARKIAAKHGYSTTQVKFETCDILADPADATLPLHGRTFDVLFDKGTYDAVSLDPEGAKIQRDKYIANVRGMLNDGAFLVITSCNWTKDELLLHFQERKTLSRMCAGNHYYILVFQILIFTRRFLLLSSSSAESSGTW